MAAKSGEEEGGEWRGLTYFSINNFTNRILKMVTIIYHHLADIVIE